MTHPALPNHLTLTGRPLLLLPTVVNELHARLQAAYSPRGAKLADKLMRRAIAKGKPNRGEATASRVLATRIQLSAGTSVTPVIQADPYLAHIAIEGPLLNKAAMWGDMVCVDGYDRIEADIAAAMADPDCAGILLDIDSPGGMVNGCFELADKIGVWAKEKPIVTHTSGLLCSAAYALASQTSEIHAALTATTGSIGVIYGRYDFTGKMKKDGVRIDMITSGDRKSWGHPETEMSDAELAATESEINALADMFFTRVAEGRGLTTEAVADMQAGAFLTAQAQDLGLVNSLTDLSGALARLSSLAAGETPEPAPDPIPVPPAPEPVADPSAASTSTPKLETHMSKSFARHRASLAIALTAAACTLAFATAEGLDEDELKTAIDEDVKEDVDGMDDEDVKTMDVDEDVAAMEEDDDLEAMDDEEIAQTEDAMDDDDEEVAPSAVFRAKASRIAKAATARVSASADPAPAPTGDAVKDAVAAERHRMSAINNLPEAVGREALAAELAAEGMSVDGAKRVLGKAAKPSKRGFAPPSPKLGTGGSRSGKTDKLDDVLAKHQATKAKA